MQAGKKNLLALRHLSRRQQLVYDFGFRELEMPVDLSVLYLHCGAGAGDKLQVCRRRGLRLRCYLPLTVPSRATAVSVSPHIASVPSHQWTSRCRDAEWLFIARPHAPAADAAAMASLPGRRAPARGLGGP